MDLQAPVQFVKGIGPQKAQALGKAGVVSAEDLLLHLPMRYEDRRSFARVADLVPGMRVSVAGEIVVAGLRRARRMAIYEVRLDDGARRNLPGTIGEDELGRRGAHVDAAVERAAHSGPLRLELLDEGLELRVRLLRIVGTEERPTV